ncbi:hypothetical protein JHK85_021860 [Glycine max]|nr:hypothetical protein JHK85_021860 [Glycine max]
METLHRDPGGGIENLDLRVSNLGHQDHFCCSLCPDVNIVYGARNNDEHMHWIIVPIIRKFTGKERGLSMLQRMGIGLFISVLCMLSAAVVEIMHLQLAKELDLVDKHVAVPLSVLWQIPLYFFLGAAEVFTFVGQLEFLYDQSPNTMKTLGTAMTLLNFSLGNYLSSFILTMNQKRFLTRDMSSIEGATQLLEEALLQDDEESKQYTRDGSVDYRGRPAIKKDTGNWRACPFILGNECCERLAFFGIATNLVTYLTTKLHEGNVSAARNVSIWLGTSYLTPLIGAVLGDGYWGRYWTIAVFSVVYFIGMCTLTLSASLPALKPAECLGSVCPSATPAQYAVFYFGLYVIALGIGGIKSWGSPVTRMCQVLCASVRKWNLVVPEDSSLLYEMSDKRSAIKGSRKLLHSDDLRCLDRAATVSDYESKSGDYSNPWRLCPVTQVEELKILIRMFPMWATGAVFSAVYTQMSTLFVEQGTVMNTNIGSFEIPPASLATFDVLSVVLWAPVYDRIIVPITRKFTGNERGISVLQRVSIGYFISVLSMLAAVVVEIMRLRLARDLDLVDEPVAVPLSILWQIPQYFLLGAAEVFAFVGLLEFFYDQSPDTMKTLGTALSPLYFALGNYLSSFILTMVTYFTTQGGKLGWIPDNLNKGHLDYFFLLLAGLSFLNMLVYIVAAKRYKQTKTS